MAAPIKYVSWSSDIELAFYAALASLKIDRDRLDDSARKVLGLYEIRPGDEKERSARMQIHSSALTTNEVPGGYYRAEGYIKNYNTIEDFKNADRSMLLELAARTIWDAIHDETIYSCPSLLCSFYAISFANLKKYKFTYHFAFPAIQSDMSWKLVEGSPCPRKFTTSETTLLVECVQTWRYGVDPRQHGFFLAKRVYRHDLTMSSQDQGEETRPKTPQTPGLQEELGFSWVIGALAKYKEDFFQGVDKADQFICFADPSNYPENPGWQIRNLLVLIQQLWQLTDVQILCYRDTHMRREHPNSLILHLHTESAASDPQVSPGGTKNMAQMPKVVGWERNLAGKVGVRSVDLGEYMDPTRLADQAVDLNLKLIKWRIAPRIDLDVIKNTKCLLLGAGTLGSYVSRNLMGWGARKITFVDNATVSFSNPVRQPLFDFKDCLQGGAKKAHRAAEVLAEIYPGVEAEGHVMSVPMAGHPIMDEENVKSDFFKLKTLIEEHDAIFLLLDTRESRWLPTLMGKAAGKIVMNAALGFDSFVVMRHGLPAKGEEETEMGCYFCNDVVAPADSIKDATLDQQCTVTRPGIAPIASALLVELLVSILQHPLRARAPHSVESQPLLRSTPTASMHPLGGVPHQIRGFLGSWNNLPIEGRPYDCCSACSDNIVTRYNDEGWDFVKRAINEKGWVEEISGLAEVQRKAEEAEKDLDWDEDDEIEDVEEGDGELL